MRNCIFVAIALALFACVGTASADQASTISQDALVAMGLGDLQPMTEQAGLEVRGKGFASVEGFGFPAYPSFASKIVFRPYEVAWITITSRVPGMTVSVSAWGMTF